MEVVAAAIVGGLVGHLISGGATVKLGDKEIYLGQPYKGDDKGQFLRQLFDASRDDSKTSGLKSKYGYVNRDIKHHNAFFKINGVEYKLHLDTEKYTYTLTKK